MNLSRCLFSALVFLIPCWCLGACTTNPTLRANQTGVKDRLLIIDTDLAFDDLLAMVYLLNKPGITIKAITISVRDDQECLSKSEALKALLAIHESSKVPIGCGSIHQPGKKFPDQTAVGLLASALQSSPEKMTLLALGPLTNIAEVFKQSPSLKKKIERIYLMGGAIAVPGNVMEPGEKTANPVAEWNFYRDPGAANQVLCSKVPVTLVPLDATNQVPLTPEFIDRIRSLPTTAQTKYILRVMAGTHKPMEAGRTYFWDPLTAAIFSDETLAGFEMRHLRVIEEPGPQQGRVIIDPAGPEVRVAFRVDRNRFEQNFIDTLAPLSINPSNERPFPGSLIKPFQQ